MAIREYSTKVNVRVEFYTRHYHVSGDVQVNRWRLADVLNDRSDPFVLMQNVVREPLPALAATGGELARAAQFLQIAKESVLFAIPHEAPELEVARQQYLATLYSERGVADANAIMPPWELRGTVHLRRVSGPQQALEDTPGEFIPMTHIEASYLLDGGRLRVAADLAIVNRLLAELFSLTAERSIQVHRGFRRDS